MLVYPYRRVKGLSWNTPEPTQDVGSGAYRRCQKGMSLSSSPICLIVAS